MRLQYFSKRLGLFKDWDLFYKKNYRIKLFGNILPQNENASRKDCLILQYILSNPPSLVQNSEDKFSG